MGGAHIVLIGAGAVGSHAGPHLARAPEVERITIVDFDRYQESSLRSQAITPDDVGHPKAAALARRLRRIRAGLKVDALTCRLEHVPLGRLRADAHISCCDNRPARIAGNEAAYHLAIPAWIDAGVRASESLARATLHFPALAGAACHVCGWGRADWAALGASYSCDGQVSVPATGSPTHLSAMAAAMAVRLCLEFLAGRLQPQPDLQHSVYSAELHRAWITTVRRNPACTFDHQRWTPIPAGRRPADLTLGGVFAEFGEPVGVTGLSFARRLVCASCGRVRETLALAARISARDRRCPACGGEGVAGALDLVHELDSSAARSFGAGALERSLAELGLLPGDFLRCGRGFIELCGRPVSPEEIP